MEQNLISIKKRFQAKNCWPDNRIIVLQAKDALDLISCLQLEGLQLLGISGFRLVSGNLQPNQDLDFNLEEYPDAPKHVIFKKARELLIHEIGDESAVFELDYSD